MNYSKKQILERRKEIEQKLVEMLKETDPSSPKASERAGKNSPIYFKQKQYGRRMGTCINGFDGVRTQLF